MKNIFITLFLLTALCPALNAQSYRDVRDFNNTFEINVHKEGDDSMAKCQAVRLSKTWFITAAHCVRPICDSSCTIDARMLLKDGYEIDLSVNHSATKPAVFLNERASLNKTEAGYDIALINFKPEQSKYLYKSLAESMLYPKDIFVKKAPFTFREYNDLEEATNIPSILSLKAQTPKMLNRQLAVVSIWDGNKSVMMSQGIVIFSPKQHYIYTPNFGIRQGISGSGVMTTEGELVGIVSSTASITTTYTDDVSSKTDMANFSFMSIFDEYMINFLKRNMGNIQYATSDTDTLKVIPEDYKAMALSVDNTVG